MMGLEHYVKTTKQVLTWMYGPLVEMAVSQDEPGEQIINITLYGENFDIRQTSGRAPEIWEVYHWQVDHDDYSASESRLGMAVDYPGALRQLLTAFALVRIDSAITKTYGPLTEGRK